MQADMNAKKYFKCFELFYKTGKDLPTDMKIQYYDALMEYGLYGNLPDDPVIKSLLQGAIYSIDKADEKRKKKSDYMKGNSNAVKNWEKVSKQTKTDTDRNEQTETYEDKEDIEDKEEKKENKKEKKVEEHIPTVSELVGAYENNDLLTKQIGDTKVVRNRVEYKQAKKSRAYKTIDGFTQQLSVIVDTIRFGQPRGDVSARLQFAINQAKEGERKGIHRTEQTENEYQYWKKTLAFTQKQNEGTFT